MFRELVPDDIAPLVQAAGDVSHVFPRLEEHLHGHLCDLRTRPTGIWVLVDQSKNDRLVGFTSIIVRGDEAYLAYVISSAVRGQGFATEAAAATIAYGLRLFPHIYATVFPDNIASKNVLERCGMQCLGEVEIRGRVRLRYAISEPVQVGKPRSTC
jgi:RimJ/RimL family protein N-acetyltransferase